ncbi:hypothetical protein PRZ48_002510 [Zasmidium cellare]|uniref:Kri1-like C-terminal domain-containing protein n=1 Tax=Zasmidium cellare TaxID=395010 RepID=A0ABR0F4A0_ZASCE|nr:hypothetical protein PRZ48_002510 [Zasmidium cellare]
MARPAKRTKLLDDGSDSDNEAGVKLNINEEYAKRFEHNKKREEKHQLEEKYKNEFKRKRVGSDEESEGDSEDDESEDDDAQLATEDVDDEIMATLQAIRTKDPKVYDANVKFFKEFDPEQTGGADVKKEKPMYLQDYHRENLLAGRTGAEEEDERPQTYAEEQEQLKRELVGSMHAAGQEESEEDDFMVAKRKPKHEDLPAPKAPKPKKKKITDDDIKTADKDPETYLSNFMAARAWLPGEGSRWEAFESDDSDDDKRADEFEEAYNMRFEDPNTANEKLQSFARDVGKYGVRRDEKTGRAKAREREKERKEAEKQEREEDKARLRKLKIEDAEEKVKRIKEAAGLRGQEALNLDEWRDVIEGDFDDEKWEAEMKRRFGEQYYADEDVEMGSGDEGAEGKKKHKPKKPKWDDDIDIGDLVSDFEDDEKAKITLTDDEDAEEGGVPLVDEDDDDTSSKKKKKNKKDREKEKADAKRTARKERMKIEEMVDAALPLHEAAASSSSGSVGFRYRDTSPTAFGLSARDILFADDSALNQYAGLKKMAAFRDEEKKRKDKKRYSKKQRLKQWRKETFGKPDEPAGGFEKILGYEEQQPAADSNVKEGSRKKKRSKGKKSKSEDAGEAVDA